MNIFAYNKAWLGAGVFGGAIAGLADLLGTLVYQGFPALGMTIQSFLGWDEPSFEGKVVWAATAVAVYLVRNKGA